MRTPEALIFVRNVNCVQPLTLKECQIQIQGFKPTLTAPYQVFVDQDVFTVRFGGRGQIALWIQGKFQPIDDDFTRIIAEIGVERSFDNLKLVGGLLLLVVMMTLAEILDNELIGETMFGVLALFVGGFLLVLIGGMAYSQHRLRNDIINLMCRDSD